MATKNIAITEDAYKLLARHKIHGKSFSEVIREHFGKRSLLDCAGIWENIPGKKWKVIESNISKAGKGISESLKKRIGALHK